MGIGNYSEPGVIILTIFGVTPVATFWGIIGRAIYVYKPSFQ